MAEGEDSGVVPNVCNRLYQSLLQCHRHVPPGRGRDSACWHLNQSLSGCLVATICPDEVEAVQSLCKSAGTALKRSQCEQAQVSLAVCLSSHQNPNPNSAY